MSLPTTPAAYAATDSLHRPFGDAECDEIDLILDDIRTRFDETPQWEFCDGFMAALICCRRAIPFEEYLSVLLDWGNTSDKGEQVFASSAQSDRFRALWQHRWAEIATALDNPVEDLSLPEAYGPIVLDVRGSVAQLAAKKREEIDPEEYLPSYAQVWAIGFMYAVENWPQEWLTPRDKPLAKAYDEAMGHLLDLTDDDNEPLLLEAQLANQADQTPKDSEGGVGVDGEEEDDHSPIHASQKRFDQFAMAIWAVYDLREIWRQVGPRVETVYNPSKLGRNDPCHCGSGKKFKQCHGG